LAPPYFFWSSSETEREYRFVLRERHRELGIPCGIERSSATCAEPTKKGDHPCG
jgi:hypothetical protein